MKILNQSLMAIVCMACSFVSCDSNDDYKPESVVEEALKAKYPTATHVEWEKKKEYQVADCIVESRELDVWFTANAEWKMTETDLRKTDIPTAIAEAIAASEYANWLIDDVDVLEYPAKAKEYVIEVEQGIHETDLYYSEAGELLRTKVTTADDTHWPE